MKETYIFQNQGLCSRQTSIHANLQQSIYIRNNSFCLVILDEQIRIKYSICLLPQNEISCIGNIEVNSNNIMIVKILITLLDF